MKGSWDARCSGLIYMCEMRVLDGSIPCYRLTHVHSGIVGGKRRRSRACATIAEMRLMICGGYYSVVPRLRATSGIILMIHRAVLSDCCVAQFIQLLDL